MWNKFLLSITFVALLVIIGCTTPAAVMKSWLGHQEPELVSKWGAPDSVVKLSDGSKVYTWIRIWSDANGVHQGRQSFTIDVTGKVTYWSYENMPRLHRNW